LCDENDGDEYFRFGNEVNGWTAGYNYSEISGAVIRFIDNTPPYQVRLWGLKNTWTKNADYAIEAQDEGLGIAAFSVEIPPGKLNESGQPFFAENVSCPNGGIDGCPRSGKSKPINFSVLGTGIYTLGVYAYDEAGNETEEHVNEEDEEDLSAGADPKLYLDETPPKMAPLSGSLAEANSGVIGSGNYALNFSAEDGSTLLPQSGMYKFLVYVDGRLELDDVTSCPVPHGIPTSECFNFSGGWTFEGQKYGAGSHTITVAAIDWAGNESSETVHVTVNEAPYEAAGPGGVNLKTGDYKIVAGDVSAMAGGGDLALGRSYDSRELTEGSGGPLGPQWSLSVPDSAVGGTWQSLQALPNGSVEMTTVTGERLTFVSNGSGGFVSPAGYQTDTLTEPSKSPAEYRLTDAVGDATTFTRVSSSGEEVPLFVPSGSVQAEGAGGLNKTSYLFAKTSEGVVEPTAIVAPYTSSLKCVEKLEKHEEFVNGCRALTFSYATETKAKGEGSTEWGEYKGRLAEVYLKTWSKSAEKITSTAVAQYAYDILGRLRAEWNPEISPALKTVYGYDPAGHVTAVTPPGQETWTLTYGTIAGDSNTGRLIKVTQAPAAMKLWGGQAPKNTEAPKLSGTAVVGVTMGASSGLWSNEPVSYAYQWDDCNVEGKACTAILGATNANYTVASSDVGHTLVSQVTATNGGGSVSTTTAASTVVTTSGTKTEGTHYNPSPGTTMEYHVPLSGAGLPTLTKAEVEKWDQKEDLPAEATAIFQPDKPMGWPAKEYTRATIYYQDIDERLVNVSGPTGGISTIEYNSHNSVVRSLSPDDRATALKESKTVEAAEKLSTKSVYNGEGTDLEETLGPEHEIKLSGAGEVQARKKVKYTYNEAEAPTEGRPYRLVTSTKESALVAGKEEEPRTVNESYSGQENLGWKLHAPTSTTADPEGLKLVHTILYSPSTGAVIETQMPAVSADVTPIYTSQFSSLGSGNGQVNDPRQMAMNGKGDLFVADEENSRIDEFTEKGEFVKTIGSAGSGSGQLLEPKGVAIDSKGNIWIADTKNNRVEEFNEKGEYVRVFGSAGAEHGQFKEPKSVAVDLHNNVYIADTGNNRVQEFNEKGEYVKTIGIVGTGNGDLKEPRAVAIAPNGALWVADTGNNRIEEFNEKGEYVKIVGSAGTGNGQFKEPKGITFDSHGNMWIVDTENNRVEEFSEKGEYELQFGSGGSGTGELKEPWGIGVDKTGEVFVVDSENDRIEKWVPANPLAHDSQTIYYTTGTEASVAACQNHPEWAGLPCQTQPAHQPETTGLPALPTTITTYTIWDSPETTKSTSGEATRTDTNTYDSAGRLTSKETTSTTGSSLPKIKYEYNTENGLLAKQSAGSGSEEKKITSVYNTLGETTSYTEAEGSVTTYEYEKEQDARLKKITDPKGSQTYGYSTTTGEVNELVDSAAGTFTASYDTEGNLTSENYPNGMTATHTYNPVGEATALKYKKTTHCTEETSEPCVMFKDSVVPNIHNEWATQTSTLSSQGYAYDNTGRLTEVQSTSAGQGCIVRLYTYDADGNRTTLTTRSPGTEGKCASEGGTSETHSYDTADRLADTGTIYDPFGDITTLGATDADGSELKSSYYADGQLASQEQAGQTIGYNLDPARRAREIVSTGKSSSDVTNHYDGAGSTPSWTSYPSGETTRNIGGIDGGLAAIQYNSEKPIIQLANLHGDIIGTIKDSETEIHPESTTDTTEYGVPTTSKPPKYSWLGADELPTELPSGVIGMGARSYVPEIGRFLQPDPSPGGSANAYAYTQGDPLNETDPSGEWTLNETSGGLSAVGTGEGTQLPGGIGIAEGAIMPAPVNLQIEAAFRADPPWDQVTAGNEEYEEYEEYEEEWEEEGGEEYASYKHGVGHQEAQTEPALLVQPLVEGADTSNGDEGDQGARRDVAGGCPSTHDPCYKHVAHHSGKANEGAACDRRSGCGGGAGNHGCYAMVFVGGSPGIWTPAGWVAIAIGEAICASQVGS
jgi:RHS repeat-associated protein